MGMEALLKILAKGGNQTKNLLSELGTAGKVAVGKEAGLMAPGASRLGVAGKVAGHAVRDNPLAAGALGGGALAAGAGASSMMSGDEDEDEQDMDDLPPEIRAALGMTEKLKKEGKNFGFGRY